MPEVVTEPGNETRGSKSESNRNFLLPPPARVCRSKVPRPCDELRNRAQEQNMRNEIGGVVDREH
jgi:hypothetical protein